jgi:hypothetical protein
MTVEALMTETVTVRHHDGFTQSASGEPTPVYIESETVMYLEPKQDARRSTEALEVGYVPTGLWLGIGLADFPFDPHDQIVWESRVFDIIAPPRIMPNPRLDTLSHTELDLQEVGEFEAGVDATATPGVVGGFGG